MSAAGLYESVANVSAAEGAALQSALCTVWASLFSRRAILARKVAGIPQVRLVECRKPSWIVCDVGRHGCQVYAWGVFLAVFE